MTNKPYKINVKKILEITNGKLICGNENIICENFCRDSRDVTTNDIYLGIKGENQNGSIYFEEALKKGAIGAILQDIEISDEIISKYSNKFIIIVENTVLAMQQIATYKRSLYNIPTIAITGSVGKTSTKDMISSVVMQKYNTLKTQGNYNNHIGVPLTLFNLKDENAMVIEMGMSHLNEISLLTNIVKPTIAVITNVGTAHIGNLGSRANILKAKLEILEGLSPDGYLVLNNDNDLLHDWYLKNKDKYNIITFGIENTSDFMATNIISSDNSSTFTLKSKISEQNNTQIKVPVGGNHFVLNSLCSIAVGYILNIPFDSIKNGILTFELTKNRMDITRKNNITIINDAYNANYDSMKASLDYLGKLQNQRKIAVLGDMLELGEFSKKLHEDVGTEVANNNIDILITVGQEAKHIAKQAKTMGLESNCVFSFDTNQEAINKINSIKQSNDVILLKASNGMHFKEIVESI